MFGYPSELVDNSDPVKHGSKNYGLKLTRPNTYEKAGT